MATTLEELKASIEAAVAPGFQYKLLARGQARGMIWRDGVLPLGAPDFAPDLSDNLLSYGYSLLTHALRYAGLGGDSILVRAAFGHAAEALEAVVARGNAETDRDFHRLVAAAAYHLGRYSAKSYSLLQKGLAESNLSTTEMILAKLMLRNLGGVSLDLASWFSSGIGSDEALIETLKRGAELQTGGSNGSDDHVLEALTRGVDANFMSAIALMMLALERGEEALILQAQERLSHGLEVAGELNLVCQWWCHRLAMPLIEGLWETSFHKVLPMNGLFVDGNDNWLSLRKLFICSLYKRGKAEIELWPSQLVAAQKVLNFDTNLVLSLPTSAGKTRIAEMCILACFGQSKRVIFMTPLRALSAQTEIVLRRTFGPLGKTVSSLYGSIGATGTDVDALRVADIVVATPEKLDFALRSDPTLLDDIGLIVLDEGHMIGLGEREVRYEMQIQRLLRRPDAATRRIVCLSAILPSGEQLEDFAAWLTCDKLDGLIKDDWRPTRLRFGEVVWNPNNENALLNITVGTEKPFIPEFIVGNKPNKGRFKKVFPSDQKELCIATAWRLMADGQTVLVFCPRRNSVLSFAKSIIDMHNRGHIASVFEGPDGALERALAVGAEWFGSNNAILECLKLGIAVHHGALPTAYRKEVESLIRNGMLKLTVSSPTLAQGLNLAATCLIFQGLVRYKETIDIAEFRNVIGRAGRAYVDMEGLVLYPMFDNHSKRKSDWDTLVFSQKGREMESGLVRLVLALLERMMKKTEINNLDVLLEYVTGQGAWDFPTVLGEKPQDEQEALMKWEKHLMSLDTAILSLVGDSQEVDDGAIDALLGELLVSSLFKRRLSRVNAISQELLTAGFINRGKFIWSNTSQQQRRGYFLAGVGLVTGKVLDEESAELERFMIVANQAIISGEQEQAVNAIIAFADIVFRIKPFAPKTLLPSWKDILRLWLLGQPVTELLSGENSEELITFIEQAFVYNLPWAMEAVRVRAEVFEDVFSEQPKLSDFPRVHVVAALETGTLSIAAATLVHAGFSSRLAAIKAVEDTSATFESLSGLWEWIASDQVQLLSAKSDWPSLEMHQFWLEFSEPIVSRTVKEWSATSYSGSVVWHAQPPSAGTPLRIGGGVGEERSVFTADFQKIGALKWALNPHLSGIMYATANGSGDKFDFEYIGPNDLLL